MVPRTIYLASLVLSCICSTSVLWAQQQESMELTRSAVQTKRHEIVQMAMSLTPSELDGFKDVYRAWRSKVEALGDRKVRLVERLTEGHNSLTDAEAKALTNEWLKIQTDELSLKRTYVDKFRKVIPEKKVARFFQLENKLDAALLYNLAGTVPMVESD